MHFPKLEVLLLAESKQKTPDLQIQVKGVKYV